MKNKRSIPRKKCKHKNTFGGVGAEKHICLDCKKVVDNTTYQEELEEIAYAKEHPKSNTPVATAIRRMKKIKEELAGKKKSK